MWLLSVICDRPRRVQSPSQITTLNPRYIYGVNPKSKLRPKRTKGAI
ncbi:MAG: hypothetical protein V7K50_20840 [Nostoc sp.]